MPRRAIILVLFLVLAACRRTPETRVAGTPEAPDAPVIIISVDTLRADHLPAYGYRAIQTPAIDALRKDAILFANAYSHCPMTLPSHVSLFTGLLPFEHGVRNNLGYTFDGKRHDTLMAMLDRAGYKTGAAVSAYVLRGETGVGSEFDFYEDNVAGATNVSIAEVARAGEKTEEVAWQWIAQQRDEPFFFFLHLFEPHTPYEGSYDAEIVRSDAIVGRFLQRLKQAGIYDRALIFFLSDHGEGLGDHGEGEHGVFVYRETIQVPLLVKLPKSQNGGTVAAPVQLIDVVPTVAAITGARPRAKLAGASLLDVPATPRRIYSETMLPRIHFGWSELRSLVDGTHHFIEAPSPELYQIVQDPREQTNIAAAQRRVLADMRGTLGKLPAAFTAPTAVDAEEAGKLAALGYIGQVRTSDSGNLPDPKARIVDLEQLKSGSAMERRGELAQAMQAYETIVARNPQFADAWLRIGALQEMLGRSEEAVRAYRNAISAAPVLAGQTALPLGALYLKMGRLDDAAAHAGLAMRTQPAAAHHLLGRVALARRDFATAAREAGIAAADKNYAGPGAVLLARVLIAQGRFPDALNVLDRLKASAPVRDLQFTRGEILGRMERIEEAESAFLAEIRHFPRNTDPYAHLAMLYFATGRPRESEATLQQMIKASPTPQTTALAEQVRKALQ
jgi:arylsulfatase A-like enzyme/Flp pilus assembly protein TadD